MSEEEFSQYLKGMPCSEDLTGQGFVKGFSLPKSAMKTFKGSKK
jgi:hypothetical protein